MGFFADAAEFLDEAPALAVDIKFCIETDTDTVDLRNAHRATLDQLLVLVDRVSAANHNVEPARFHSPEAFPTYVRMLDQLRSTVASLIGDVA
jgi:hypothetical protein